MEKNTALTTLDLSGVHYAFPNPKLYRPFTTCPMMASHPMRSRVPEGGRPAILGFRETFLNEKLQVYEARNLCTHETGSQMPRF